jgi:pimeloyl-[acyl-carrier protein] synthase
MAFADLVRPVVIQGLLLKERLKTGVVFNPLSDGYHQDPTKTYARLREKDPVHYSELIRGWVVSHYEDVDAILRDHRRFSNDGRLTGRDDFKGPSEVEETPSMLFLDPPDHTRLRSLVSQAFTPRAIEAWRGRVEETADRLIAEVGEAKRFDFMEAIAVPLPVVVISEMLGIPLEDRARFKAWSDDLARTLEPTITKPEIEAAHRSRRELREYLGPIVDARRTDPREDLISILVRAEAEGEKLTREEVISTLILLLVAGNETTTNLIGNGMLALLRQPEQRRWLEEHPDEVEAAVEEILRYDSPVQTNGRIALEDVTIRGKTIRKGSQIVLLQGGGNRDAEHYERPDALDLSRGDKGHLSFGRGIHHCLGAPLARLEGQVIFPKVLARWPRMRIAADPKFKDHVVLRGLRALEVDVS